MAKLKFVLALWFGVVGLGPLCWAADSVQVLVDEPISFDQEYGWIWSVHIDQQQLRFVLDTGASTNMMVKTAARKLDLSCKNAPGYLYTGDGSQSPGMISGLGRLPLIIGSQKHHLQFWCFDAPNFFAEGSLDGVISVHQLFDDGDYTIFDPLKQRVISLKGSSEAVKAYLQTYSGTKNPVHTLARKKLDDDIFDDVIFIEENGRIFGFDTGAEITEISSEMAYASGNTADILEAEITDAQGHTIKMHVIKDYNLVFCNNNHNLHAMVHNNEKRSLGLTKDKEKVVAILGRDVLNNYLLAFPQDKSEPILGIQIP